MSKTSDLHLRNTASRLENNETEELARVAHESFSDQSGNTWVKVGGEWEKVRPALTVSELTLIDRYRAPQYLVDVTGDCDGHEVATVNEHGFEVIDTEIKGWGSHNAIIRTDWADYLATLVER